MTRHYRERSQQQRQRFIRWWIANGHGIYLDELVFIDESHFNDRTADRLYGKALSGEPAIVESTGRRGRSYSAIAGVSLEGIIGFRLYER